MTLLCNLMLIAYYVEELPQRNIIFALGRMFHEQHLSTVLKLFIFFNIETLDGYFM